MPIEDSRGAKLAALQEAKKKAEQEQNTSKIAQLQSQIERFQAEDKAGWEQALDDAAVTKALGKQIAKRKTKEQITAEISSLEDRIQRLTALPENERLGSEEFIPPLKEELEKHQIALQISKRLEAEKQEKAAAELVKQKEKLFEPILFHNTVSYNWGQPYPYNISDSEARQAGLERLIQMVKSPSITLEKNHIQEFKGVIMGLINSKSMHKTRTPRSSHDDPWGPAHDFFRRLTEVKSKLNARLYPTYGTHIDALENYIADMRAEGVTTEDKRKVKTIIFKSDRSRKLDMAEKLKDKLIAFENKSAAEKEADPDMTVDAIKKLIEQNQKATGSVYLHGKGKLDEILKNLKEKIEDPAATRPTPSLLKDIQRSAISKAVAEKSNHFFREEIIRLNKQIESIKNNTAYFLGFKYHFTTNGKENLHRAEQLRELLVNSTDSIKDRQNLEPRINGMLENPKLNNELRTILSEIKTRIEIKGPNPDNKPKSGAS